MVQFSGKITYILVTPQTGRVRFDLEGMANISKGLFEYPATPDWQTVWRIYDSSGRIVFEDARHHSMMPFSQTDSAIDRFSAEIDQADTVYTIQLFGRISGETGFIEQQSVTIAGEPVATPSPVPTPPKPMPVPLPPTPAPLPTPPGDGGDGGFKWPEFGMGAGAIVVIALIALVLLRR